jgi:glucose/arabinose dehydrogenase
VDKDGTLLPEPFLDLTRDALGTGVDAHFLDQGMLGLAFHPDYASNGRFYVAYTDFATNGDLIVVEFQVSADDPNKVQSLKRTYRLGEGGRVLLDIDQPYVTHNGGTLQFGPDEYLYIALGDGGGDHDPFDNAQDRFSLLGKLLRIDVDGGLTEGQGKKPRAQRVLPYGIPPDNPFASVAVPPSGEPYSPPVRQEIWASGLRSPWQFSFDPATGDLYIPDVGQETWEEINFQPADNPGGQNYGWDWMEGSHCYPVERADCQQLGVLPVAEYKHGEDNCAIVGIGIYRGEEFPSLDGIYFSGDFCSGKIWGLQRDEAGAWMYRQLLDTELVITGAGRDESGNLYITTCNCSINPRYDPFEHPQGKVWRLVTADRIPEGAETAPLQSEAVVPPTSNAATPIIASIAAA